MSAEQAQQEPLDLKSTSCDVPTGDLAEVRASVLSVFPASVYKPQCFEQAVKNMRLPDTSEVVSACNEQAQAAMIGWQAT